MSKPRILIVEDELIVARDIGQQLIALGYEPVGSCAAGEEAVDLATQLKPDLILMDIQLAGAMDGIAAAQLIRARLALPVVFLTAFAESETVTRAKQAEPFGYIIKPFDERELRTVIEMALFKHVAEARLRESEQRFRSLVETSLDAVVLGTLDGKFLHANAAALAMFRTTEAEIVSLGRDAFADRGDPRVKAALEERDRTGRFHGELTLIRRNGEKFPAEVSSVVFSSPDGQKRTSLVIRDISERHKAEHLLRLQGAALEAADNAIMITDRDGTIEWVNPAFQRLTGYTLAESIGRNPREIARSGIVDKKVIGELWATITSGRAWRGEMINRRKDGSTYPEEETITPVRSPAGEITHFVAIKQDLTQARKAAADLQASEERYRLLFDQNPLPMWVYEMGTLRILAVNDAAVRQYGYTREEFLRTSMKGLLPADDETQLLQALESATDEIKNLTESRHRRKDGSVFPVEVSARPLEVSGLKARLVLAADISEKKELQDRFLRAQRLESLGMLASGIAHDLNNMLAPIIFVGPLLRQTRTTPDELKIIGTLERSAERGVGLVRQILAFAQGSTGEPRLTQIKHIARDIIHLVEETFPRSIQIEHSIPSDLWPAIVNPTQIHQVLLNLCVNSRDAMPNGGTLRISAANRRLSAAEAREISEARAGAWLMLEVSDTGTGIPPEVLKQIWEPFFTTKAPDVGTGLGLSTVRGIVAGHAGFTQIATQVGKGSTFRVFVPADAASHVEEGAQAAATPADGSGEHILVADDDEAVREIITTLLTARGYRVTCCADGIEALKHFNARPREFDLVITDIDMPNIGGGLLSRVLLQLRPDVKLLAISGLVGEGAPGSELDVTRQLVHGFLLKPFAASELFNAIRRLLPSGHA